MAEPATVETFADLVVGAIKSALAPVLAKQQALADELADVRRSLADLSTSATLADRGLVERVVAIEVKMAQPLDLGDLRDRLTVLETRTAGPTTPETMQAVAGLSDRLRVIETKADATTAPPHDDGALVDLRARIGTLETKAQTDADLRERIAVLETRAPVPGPPGPAGADGKDGRDGADGFGFEDFEASYDGERTLTHAYRKGDRTKAFSWLLPIPIYRGLFEPGRTYDKGDTITVGGSLWAAMMATSAKPESAGPEARAWRLAVKRGNDAKPQAVSHG